MSNYIYKERVPSRIGLSVINAFAAKILVTPVLGHAITLLRGKQGSTQATVQKNLSVKPPNPPIPSPKIESLKNQIGIYIINEDATIEGKAPIYIYLDFIPRQLAFSPTGLFKSIAVLGRNNPLYHYGGGEDSLQVEIEWYAFKNDPLSVIQKCRKMEALCKADGWNTSPPLINFQWGRDNPLFENHMYLVEKAPYKATQFTKNYRINSNKSFGYSMQPIRATQILFLKRVTAGQLTHSQIINYTKPHQPA